MSSFVFYTTTILIIKLFLPFFIQYRACRVLWNQKRNRSKHDLKKLLDTGSFPQILIPTLNSEYEIFPSLFLSTISIISSISSISKWLGRCFNTNLISSGWMHPSSSLAKALKKRSVGPHTILNYKLPECFLVTNFIIVLSCCLLHNVTKLLQHQPHYLPDVCFCVPTLISR